MASAAEQLAASINWNAFGKATELKNRIWFTLGALVIYRIACTKCEWLEKPRVCATCESEGLAPAVASSISSAARTRSSDRCWCNVRPVQSRNTRHR